MKKNKSTILNSIIGSIVLAINLNATVDINATQQKLTSSDIADSDFFSQSVAVSNSYAIVGAKGDDDMGSASGSVYLFNLNSTDVNASQIKLTANDGADNDNFGKSVGINSSYAIVGAYKNNTNGSAYLYELNASNINSSQIKLTSDSNYFGTSVAISENYIIVGAMTDTMPSKEGKAYLYELNASDINTSQIKLTASDGRSNDYFGLSTAIDGNYTIIGAYGKSSSKGSAYVYELNASDINASQIELTANDAANSDRFGYSVAIKGNYAIVGAYKNNSAYLYELNASDINASQIKLTPIDENSNNEFGYSVTINDKYAIVGDAAADGNSSLLNDGAVYLFELNATDINASQKKLTSSNPVDRLKMGYSLASSESYILSGTYDDGNSYRGEAYLFDLNNSLPIASNVAISGTVNVGQSLSGSYDYSAGEGDSEVESGTTFQWYRANENNGSGAIAISGATSKTYTITSTESGKYLALGVTPKDGKEFGNEVNSSYTTTMVPVKMDFNSSIAKVNSWNMITVPDEINVSVSNISGATIWTFNNSTNAWEQPTTLTAGKGYLLYTSSSIGLVSADKVSSTITSDYTTIKNIENNNSWTLVGISKSTNGIDWVDIYNPTNTLKTNCEYTQIFYYDSVNGTWNTSSKVPYLAGIWVKQNNCTNQD